MNPHDSRWASLRSALRRTLGRPIAFAAVVGSTGFVFATLALAVLIGWRAAPFEAPSWTQAEALVLVAGAEGEVDLSALRSTLRQGAQVASVDFVGRDAALRDLAQRKTLAGTGLADLRPNPLPDAFVVRFTAGSAPDLVEASVAALRKVRSVDTVEFQSELYRRASTLQQLAGRLFFFLGAFLAAALLIALALAVCFWIRVDPEEIRVLHLLGADTPAIVRPYAYAGGLSLLAAALLAWWIAVAASAWVEPELADLAQKTGLHWTSNPLPTWGAALLCVAAGVLGAMFSALAARFSVQRRLKHSA